MNSRSWKTTLCGAIALIGASIAQFYPEQARHGLFLSAVGTGLGLLFARDNNVSSDALGIKKASEVETKKD